MNIQTRFKELRKCLNLTQTELAESIGVTRGVIANIELGRVPPRTGLLQMIVEKYKVNKDWLIDGVGEMFVIAMENIEVEQFLAEIMARQNDLYPTALKLSKLNTEDLELIDSLLTRLLNEKKEN